MQVLHLVNPDDEIFRRDYLYVKPTRAKAVAALPLIDNADGFYSNLPILNTKSKKSSHQMRLTKAQRKAMKMQLFELRRTELDRKIAVLRDEMDDSAASEDGDEEEEKEESGSGAGSGR